MSRAFPTSKPSNYARISNEPDDYGEDHAAQEKKLQQLERQKQDESLDELHSAVKRLGDVSISISTELESQNAMLDDLNEETDNASDALQQVTKKTKELIAQSGGVKNFIVIIVLTLVLVLLTYLVIMT
ncbi:hypothetical protein ABG067_001492 [Albugo candida]|uniref:t-SNARE coiled-coil homology domain-containing protein n=1 Tax=Albugo candida TaxID=65357 RepID=A0A024GRH2_9STRA|nr:unnamed protein product [Albugo candida]|eukprot:CCI49174.1 unnamed protein product [Albugo candida]